jgi:serralysin
MATVIRNGITYNYISGDSTYPYLDVPDFLLGASSVPNFIEGKGANDTIGGGSSHDILYGGWEWESQPGGIAVPDGNDFIVGYGGNDLISGQTGNDTLFGDEGNDTLIGGDGIDHLYGGSGNDSLYAHSESVSAETYGEGLYGGTGNDYLFAQYGSAILDGGDDNDIVINLTGGTAYGGNGNDAVTGQVAYGDAGSDVLYGDRHIAASLIGGNDNDLYIVNESTDTITEFANEGYDIVTSSVSYTLSDSVESLILTADNTTGIGNSSNNQIGTTFASNLTMRGGGGDDFLSAYTGNNRLYGEAGNDFLTGAFGVNGSDKLDGGKGNDLLYGWDGKDTLIGGDGNDFLAGGFGNDTLSGSSGKDTFRIDSLNDGIDRINDFRPVDDTIDFSQSGFGSDLTPNTFLNANAFIIGSRASDSSDRFIYNRSTGALFYDADGIGGVNQVQLATLSTNLNLTAADIFVGF